MSPTAAFAPTIPAQHADTAHGTCLIHVLFADSGLGRTDRSRYNAAMAEEQFGFDLGEAARPAGVYFDPDEIRSDARDLIAEARSATAESHWDEETLHYHRIAFPHLVSWLPDEDERAQLCFEFTGALERIEQLLAA